MKTIFAKEKSEYIHKLNDAINGKLSESVRISAIKRMAELESIVKQQGDELQIIVTSKNTPRGNTAPPMTMEDINKLTDAGESS